MKIINYILWFVAGVIVVGFLWRIFVLLHLPTTPSSRIPDGKVIIEMLRKKEQTPADSYLLYLNETYNGYPELGANKAEVNVGTRAIWQFEHPFALLDLQDTAAVAFTNSGAFGGRMASGIPGMLEWLNLARSLRGHFSGNFPDIYQNIINHYSRIFLGGIGRLSRAPIYEWTLYLSEFGVVPNPEVLLGKELPRLHSSFGKEDVEAFVKALLQNAMVADDSWTEKTVGMIADIKERYAALSDSFSFQPDSYIAPTPDMLMSMYAWQRCSAQNKRIRDFPTIQVWRDPRRFYPTKQYELDLKTLTPEQMREIGEEADAELCQKIAAGPLPRADRFPMFLFDPEIRPAVFLAYDKAFLADPPVPGYGESMERYLALREKLHWLNSHSRYAKYQAPLQEEFDKLAPKFADKEKAIAELEAAYLAKNPERTPAWTPQGLSKKE